MEPWRGRKLIYAFLQLVRKRWSLFFILGRCERGIPRVFQKDTIEFSFMGFSLLVVEILFCVLMDRKRCLSSIYPWSFFAFCSLIPTFLLGDVQNSSIIFLMKRYWFGFDTRDGLWVQCMRRASTQGHLLPLMYRNQFL